MFDDETSCMEIESKTRDPSSNKSEFEPSPEDKIELGANNSRGLNHSTVKLDLPDHSKLPLLNS